MYGEQETSMADDDLPETDLDAAGDDQEKAAETEDYVGVPVSDEELGKVWKSDSGEQSS
jgi:hypothetical protein